MDAARRIDELGLAPHPEGGYFRRIFESSVAVVPSDGRGDRPALTSIHFLLPAGAISRWHRVLSDEAWAHLEGGPLLLWTFDPESGQAERRRLAPRPGGEPVRFDRAGQWQAAEPESSAVLVACFVGPGFDFADFSLATGSPDVADRLRRAGDAARLL